MPKQKKAEEILYQSRTHWKILFKVFIIQLLILLVYFGLTVFLPEKVDLTSFNFDFLNKWGNLILIGLLLIPEVLYVIIPFLRWWNEKFTITNYRIKDEWGILYRDSREIDLHRIVSINEERGILDRIFGCGTLKFYDPSSDYQTNSNNPLVNKNNSGNSNGIQFHDVPNVKEVRRIIEKARYNIDDDTL